MKILRKLLKIYRNSSLTVRAGIWFLLVTIIDKGIAVLTQPIINRILTIEEVGVFGVYTSWKSIFSVVATFNLFGGVLEVYLTKEPKNKEKVVASLCSLSIVISSIFGMSFFIFGNQISDILGLKQKYLLFMALSITSEAVIQFWSVSKRFEYAYKPYALLIVGLFFTKSVLSVLLTYLVPDDRVLGRILGLAIPSIIVALILLIKIFLQRERGHILVYWKKGLLFNLPLIPHYLSSIILASSDKVMIRQLSGETDAGYYTVAYSFASLALIVFNALNSTYNPVSLRAIRDKNYPFLRKSTEFMVLLSVVFSVFMMLLAPEGILLLGGKQYLATVRIIPILIIGIYFSSFYFVFSNVEFVYEKNKLVFPITLIGALINIGLNYFLIPTYGYQAAAYTTYVGYLFIAVSHYIVSRHIVGQDIYNIKRIVCSIAILFVGGMVSAVLYNCNNIIRYAVIILMSIVLIYMAYKRRGVLLKIVTEKTSQHNL